MQIVSICKPFNQLQLYNIVKLSCHWLKYLKADELLVYQLHHTARKLEKTQMVLTLELAHM